MRNSHSQILCKIDVLKKWPKLTGKHLSWTHILIKLQVSRIATSLKRDSNTSIFLWILRKCSNIFIYGTAPDDCSCWFLRSNQVLFIDYSFFVFSKFFLFIINNRNYGSLSRKAIKMKIFSLFTIIYPKFN